MNEESFVHNVWLHGADKSQRKLDTDRFARLTLKRALSFCQGLPIGWEIDAWTDAERQDDLITIAQSRIDTEGTMARLFREGKLGSAPPLASYLARKATDSEVTP